MCSVAFSLLPRRTFEVSAYVSYLLGRVMRRVGLGEAQALRSGYLWAPGARATHYLSSGIYHRDNAIVGIISELTLKDSRRSWQAT